MTFRQKTLFYFHGMKNAGGIDYVPPALCPRAAHTSACAAAYVERTGRAEAKEIQHERSGRSRLVLRGCSA